MEAKGGQGKIETTAERWCWEAWHLLCVCYTVTRLSLLSSRLQNGHCNARHPICDSGRQKVEKRSKRQKRQRLCLRKEKRSLLNILLARIILLPRCKRGCGYVSFIWVFCHLSSFLSRKYVIRYELGFIILWTILSHFLF